MNYVLPTDRKFLCQHRNGDDFLTNPTTDFVSYMQGDNVEKMKLIATYEVSTITEASSLAQISALVVGSQVKLSHPFNSWASEGMVVGNSIRIEANGNNITETVENIVGNDMYISDVGGFISTLAVTDGDARADYVIKVLTVPTSLIFKFGIIPNSVEVANKYNSILDGQEQVYSANGIAGSTALNYLSTESSNLGTVTCAFVSTADLYVHTFTVEHVFRIPHSAVIWGAQYENGNVPTLFNGSNTYKYVNQLNFGVNINNPNDGKVFTDDELLGSIGFRGQNFNAGASVYTLNSSAVYTIGGSEAVNPEATLTTNVVAQIKKNDGNFTAGVKGFLYHSRLTSEADYSLNANTWEENFIFEQIFNVDGGGAKSNLGGIISNMTVTINGGDASLLDIDFNLTYPAAQQGAISAGDVLLLQMAIEEGALSATFSDRTVIQLNQGLSTWTKDGDTPGLITNVQFDITEVGSSTAHSNVNNWVNQAYEMDFSFDLTKSPNSDDSKLKKLELHVIARNSTTGDWWSNQIYNFPFVNKIQVVNVDGTGYQAFNIDATRFLSVPAGDSLREVQLTSVVPGAFSATQSFSGKVGFIFNWQEWIENLDVNSVFYNGSIPDEQFNLNQRISNYSNVNGYEIFIMLKADIENLSNITEYGMLSDKSSIADFDVDAAAAGWVATNTILDNQSQLSTDIYDQNMTIVRTLDMPTAGALNTAFLMGTIAIEESGNTGRHWRLHSALDYSESDNPLEPELGETGVKITQDIPGNKIILTCLVDGTKLDLTKNHNIYAHLDDNK